MRIQTDGDKAYRTAAIDRAADFYECNKTKAVVSACEDVPVLFAAVRQVLDRDTLTESSVRRSPRHARRGP